MRIDHFAYQRAAKVAGFGLLLQFLLGLVLLVFGHQARDTAFVFGSIYVLLGLGVWLSLIILFYQQKLERLESLEDDELAATRAGGSSVFESAVDEVRVAARRLHLMHTWLMPAVSLVLAALLAGIAWLMLRALLSTNQPEGAFEFQATAARGWAVAICLAGAATCFVFSRFVAGMAKQAAWQNLRGGAAYMVGNAVVMLAIAIGTIFRFFDNEQVIRAMAFAIPIYMVVLALEIALNFVLHIYRPRIPGETPRPAFDSKLLSLLSTPDSLVRSINEAVNYQFGFDVTSSWGYQLLLRSFLWLIGLGVIAIIALNTLVVVEPNQQAVKLAGGRIVGDVHGSGIMWKLPWPLQTAEVYDVTRIRELPLTSRVTGEPKVFLWSEKLTTDGDLEPFVVRGTRLSELDASFAPPEEEAAAEDAETVRVSKAFSLVDAEIVLQYRIRMDGGLMDHLTFASDARRPRQPRTDREEAIKAMALRVISQRLAVRSIDDVLAGRRSTLSGELGDAVQAELDHHRTGIEVVAVNLPTVRPAGASAATFEELGKSRQARLQKIAQAERTVYNTYTFWLGDAVQIDSVIGAIDDYNRARSRHGARASAEPEVVERRLQVERMIFDGGGNAARLISEAEKDRWVTLLDRRAQAKRMESQLVAYRAAPELYRQREIMRVMTDSLVYVRKYILGIDPARITIDVELQESNPLLNFGDAMEGDGTQ